MHHTCVPEHYICMNLCACGRDDVDVYIYIYTCVCVYGYVCVTILLCMYVCIYLCLCVSMHCGGTCTEHRHLCMSVYMYPDI